MPCAGQGGPIITLESLRDLPDVDPPLEPLDPPWPTTPTIPTTIPTIPEVHMPTVPISPEPNAVQRAWRTVTQVILAAGVVVPGVLASFEAADLTIDHSATIVGITGAAVAAVSAAQNAWDNRKR